MQNKLVSGSILAFALLSTAVLCAQECGQPDFACSGTMTCECNGQWECAGTECALPPPNYECPDGSYIQCTGSGWQCVAQGSPIIIDTKGEGYHLTSLEGGVRFAFFPGKAPVQMSWTDSAYSNGFLVLDRNGDGVINDGSELFGTETPQPPSDHPNGYIALSVYDDPSYGGNGNGVMDPADAIWPKLRIWIDANHDGVSQPGELHALDEFGIRQIGLKYRQNSCVDQYGNAFRYTAGLVDAAGEHDRRTYDVFLLFAPLTLAQPATDSANQRTALWTPKDTNNFQNLLVKGGAPPTRSGATTQIPPVAVPPGTSPLQLIRPDDPSFVPLLRQYFPLAAWDHELGLLKPVMVIVRNISDKPVTAFTVLWNVPGYNSNGAPGATQHVGYYIEAVRDSQNGLGIFASRPVMQPGEIQLVSPFFRWTGVGGPADSTPHEIPLKTFTWDPILQDIAQGTRTVSVSLDFAQLTEGQSIGPDNRGFQAYENTMRKAEGDEINAILPLLRDGAGGDEIAQALNEDVAANDPENGFDSVEHRYRLERRTEATKLLKLVQAHGPDGLRPLIAARAEPTASPQISNGSH